MLNRKPKSASCTTRPQLWVSKQRPISAFNPRNQQKLINTRIAQAASRRDRIKKKCLRSVDKILYDCSEAKNDTVNLKSLISQTKNLSQESSSHFLNKIKYSKHKVLPSSTIRFNKQYKIQRDIRRKNTQIIDLKFQNLQKSSSTSALASKRLQNEKSQLQVVGILNTYDQNTNNHQNRLIQKSKKQVILDRHGIDGFLKNMAIKNLKRNSIKSKIENDNKQRRLNQQQQIQQEIKQVVRQYKEDKYSFIYGKDGKGRFLDRNGVDLIQKCDQVLTLNPQYVFLVEKLSKKIMNI